MESRKQNNQIKKFLKEQGKAYEEQEINSIFMISNNYSKYIYWNLLVKFLTKTAHEH